VTVSTAAFSYISFHPYTEYFALPVAIGFSFSAAVISKRV
jgi:hypothetical protein